MQLVNLYQPIFREQAKVFSSRAMVEGAAVILLGIILFYVYGLWQTASLNEQLQAAQQRQQQTAKQVVELEQQYPVREKDPALAQQVKQLSDEVQMKQLVLARLADRKAGNTTGFSGQLTGLARQRLPEMWLTRIDIEQGGEFLDLEGSTLQPEQIPQFIQRLALEPAFAGLEFKSFMMDRPKKQPHLINFILLTDKKVEK